MRGRVVVVTNVAVTGGIITADVGVAGVLVVAVASWRQAAVQGSRRQASPCLGGIMTVRAPKGVARCPAGVVATTGSFVCTIKEVTVIGTVRRTGNAGVTTEINRTVDVG